MMKVFSTILVLMAVYGAPVESAGFGDWFSQSWESFGNAFKKLGESIETLGDNIKSMTADLLWFKGPNVCKTEENKTDPFADEFWGFRGSSNTYNVESCNEIQDFKIVCIARVSRNGVTWRRVRTYECCPGYVGSDHDGRKCVKAK